MSKKDVRISFGPMDSGNQLPRASFAGVKKSSFKKPQRRESQTGASDSPYVNG